VAAFRNHVLTQPTDLRPQPADLLVLLDRDPGRLAAVNLGLGDPAPQRLLPTPTCLDTVSTVAVFGRVLGTVLQHQPDGSGPELGIQLLRHDMHPFQLRKNAASNRQGPARSIDCSWMRSGAGSVDAERDSAPVTSAGPGSS
jgi:hypothetical protein